MLLDLNTPYVSEEQAEGTVGESVSAPQSLNCAFLPKMMETPQGHIHWEPRASQIPAEAPGMVPTRPLGSGVGRGKGGAASAGSSPSYRDRVPFLKQPTMTQRDASTFLLCGPLPSLSNPEQQQPRGLQGLLPQDRRHWDAGCRTNKAFKP